MGDKELVACLPLESPANLVGETEFDEAVEQELDVRAQRRARRFGFATLAAVTSGLALLGGSASARGEARPAKIGASTELIANSNQNSDSVLKGSNQWVFVDVIPKGSNGSGDAAICAQAKSITNFFENNGAPGLEPRIARKSLAGDTISCDNLLVEKLMLPNTASEMATVSTSVFGNLISDQLKAQQWYDKGSYYNMYYSDSTSQISSCGLGDRGMPAILFLNKQNCDIGHTYYKGFSWPAVLAGRNYLYSSGYQFSPDSKLWMYGNVDPNWQWWLPELGQDYLKTLRADPKITWQLKETIAGNGKIITSPAPDPGNRFPGGTHVEAIATAENGSHFVGWRGVCSGLGKCAIDMNEAETLSAIFEADTTPPAEKKNLKIAITGRGTVRAVGGIVCASKAKVKTCDFQVPKNKMLSLSETPAPNWKFNGWNGSVKGMQKARALSMAADRIVRATFLPRTTVK